MAKKKKKRKKKGTQQDKEKEEKKAENKRKKKAEEEKKRKGKGEKKKEEKGEKEKLRCPKCGEKFEEEEALKKHVQYHGTLGIPHRHWHSIMLVVAAILFIGIFAGIGNLAKQYYDLASQETPGFTPPAHNQSQVRELVQEVVENISYQGRSYQGNISCLHYDGNTGDWHAVVKTDEENLELVIADQDLKVKEIEVSLPVPQHFS